MKISNTINKDQSSVSRYLMYISKIFANLGVLPFLLLISVCYFTTVSDNFLTFDNFKNVIRQSSYLILVSMGQLFALLTGGFDLSVGTVIALTSVFTATAMTYNFGIYPESIYLSIALGIICGLIVGLAIGAFNGLGISYFGVSPFMMTLGMSSVVFGIALYMTGGMPVYGMPPEFADLIGFGQVFSIPTPVLITILLIVVLYILVNRTKLGRYFYAVGGNIAAAELSGINTKFVLFVAYSLCGLVAAITGILLTARLDSGEANIGASMPLESIAACVIAGVSLKGGIGKLENVVMGAFFIGLVQNGMNLARIESYLQTVVIGSLLILAVIADQFRVNLLNRLH